MAKDNYLQDQETGLLQGSLSREELKTLRLKLIDEARAMSKPGGMTAVQGKAFNDKMVEIAHGVVMFIRMKLDCGMFYSSEKEVAEGITTVIEYKLQGVIPIWQDNVETALRGQACYLLHLQTIGKA